VGAGGTVVDDEGGGCVVGGTTTAGADHAIVHPSPLTAGRSAPSDPATTIVDAARRSCTMTRDVPSVAVFANTTISPSSDTPGPESAPGAGIATRLIEGAATDEWEGPTATAAPTMNAAAVPIRVHRPTIVPTILVVRHGGDRGDEKSRVSG
ncbi:MAG: hypothetical protein WBV89_00575, partial [Ilumatobacter sp.]